MLHNCAKCGSPYYIEANDDCMIHKKYFCCGCYIALGGTNTVNVPDHIPSKQINEYVTERYFKELEDKK